MKTSVKIIQTICADYKHKARWNEIVLDYEKKSSEKKIKNMREYPHH